MSYFDRYGLLNSRYGEEGAENSLLWHSEYLILKDKLNTLCESDKQTLYQAIALCRLEKGIYAQNPSHVAKIQAGNTLHDLYMSHDQLTAMVAMSYKYGWVFHKEIWDEICKQGYKYDNIHPYNPKRYLHPRDIIFYGYCADNKICKLLMPLLCLITLITFLTHTKTRPTLWYRIKYYFKNKQWLKSNKIVKTDGELLAFVRNDALKNSKLMKLTWSICNLLVKIRFKNWKNLFATYFPDSNHPMNHLTKLLW